MTRSTPTILRLLLRSVALVAMLLAVASPASAQTGLGTDPGSKRSAPQGLVGGGFDACGTGGNCFVPNLFEAGCEDPACCETVCNVESICCEVAWDKLCVALAKKLCNACGSGTNSCFEVSEDPNCNDVEVCLAVCNVDPTCCDVAWDADCVRKAFDLCGSCGDACNGSCFEAHPDRPGCRDGECCAAVCLFDPRCCDVAWDQSCANLASEVCTGCGSAGAGNCCYENGTPYCNNGGCCEAVCELDPYCCDVRWDRRCALFATETCDLPTCRCGVGGAEANCKATHPLPGCSNFNCCNDVCAQDPFCCAIEWDSACVRATDFLCSSIETCGVPGTGSCFIPHPAPGCDNAGCCERVCTFMNFNGEMPFAYCCELGWDEDCARAAFEFCNDCGDIASGSCYSPHGNPHCNDEACCEAVCQIDDFCCGVIWDDLCVSIARGACEDPIGRCGSSATRPCLVPSALGGCTDDACCTKVCTIVDPYCCEVRWDQVCVAQAAALCNDLLLPTPGRGPCLEPHAVPGCSDDICASAVCEVIPECCLLGWDARCVDAARAICVNPDSGDGIGPCNQIHQSTGCEDRSCESVVCFIDPTCCQTAWDAECVSLANFNCNPASAWNCPCEGSCLEAKDTPGCRDKSCCAGVCRIDPSCCEVEWDESCVTIARAVCCGLAECGNPCAGSCLVVHDTPRCSDGFCCETVCDIDPLCCTSRWDALCVEIALARCTGACGLPTSGSCYVANGTPGCDDAACCGLVCDSATGDPFCCETELDDTCRQLAIKLCNPPECGDFLAGDCCVPHATANCRDADCCEAVCKVDTFCCDVQWDETCVTLARNESLCQDCELECGDPCAGSCCVPSPTPYCSDGDCCDAVCLVDTFCCDGRWDEFCAATARSLGNPGGPCFDACPVPQCGDPAAGNCCKPNGTPNCSDESCCETVCDLDSYCCDVAWDLSCTLLAVDNCDDLCGGGLACGDPDAGPCDKPHEDPYCDDEGCCEFVCLLDVTCCSVSWDAGCVAIADLVCSP